MSFFQIVDFIRQYFGRIFRGYTALRPENNIPPVVFFVYKMYADAAYAFSGFDYGLMYSFSVHALTSVGRQEGRMYVEYAFRESLYDEGRYAFQESG